MILASAALPIARVSIKRQREKDLRYTLREMRTAIDKFKDYADTQRIAQYELQFGSENYPASLEQLVEGVAVANDKGILEVDGCSKEMLQKLYRGRQGRIEVGDYSFTMTNLGDAKAVIDAVLAHLKTAAR